MPNSTTLAASISLIVLALTGCNGGASITSETGAPTTATTTPANDSNRFALDARIEATFSQPLLLSSVDNTNFTLHLNGNPVPAQVTFDGTTAQLEPDVDLLPSTQYTATLGSGIVDTDGKALTLHQWQFFTDGNGWSTSEVIQNNGSEGSELPQIDTDSDGNAIAVWEQYTNTNADIFANRYTASTGTWGTAELLELDNSGQAGYSKISFDKDGNAFAMWEQYNTVTEDIFTNRYTAGTDSWGGAQLLEHETGDAYNPVFSFDNDGNALFAWEQYDNVGPNIIANRFTASTGTWSTAETIEQDAGDAERPDTSMDSDGNAIAVWQQSDGIRYNIFASHYNASTGTWGSAEPIETDTGRADNVKINFDSNGNALAVWSQHDGTFDNIVANRYTASTDSWGSAELIETDDRGHAREHQTRFDSDGNAITVWQHADDSVSRYDIFTNHYTASTNSWGTEELIETDDMGDAESPQIAIDSDGNAIAVWSQNDGTRYNIIANRYTASTNSWGIAEPVETDDTGDAYSVSLSVGSDNKTLAVWTQNDKIHFSRFDPRAVAP